MKTNIYDWSDEYDHIATSFVQFLKEHASLKAFMDLGFHMEVHRTRLVSKDFSKTYDMTKTYHGSYYRNFEGGSNTVAHMVIKENYRKMQDGSLHRWLSKGIENDSDNSNMADNMGSTTFNRFFDMGIVLNTENIGRMKDNLNNNEAVVVDNMCKSKSDINRTLTHYGLVIDRIMQLVSNLGLARCYSSLYKPRVDDNTETELQSRGYNVGHRKTDVTRSLPLISIHGAELPHDSFIAIVNLLIGTSVGWCRIFDIKNVVRLHYTLRIKTKLVENERLAAIIVGYLELRRFITWRMVIGDVAMLEEIAEEMHKVFFKVKSIDWTRTGRFEKILIMCQNIEEVCDFIDEQVKIKDLFNVEASITLFKAKLIVQSDGIM